MLVGFSLTLTGLGALLAYYTGSLILDELVPRIYYVWFKTRLKNMDDASFRDYMNKIVVSWATIHGRGVVYASSNKVPTNDGRDEVQQHQETADVPTEQHERITNISGDHTPDSGDDGGSNG